jgi:hypothetical protein
VHEAAGDGGEAAMAVLRWKSTQVWGGGAGVREKERKHGVNKGCGKRIRTSKTCGVRARHVRSEATRRRTL